MPVPQSFWFIWRAPAVLAVLTAFGLLAALFGTGAWHWASWAAMAAPLAVIGGCLARADRGTAPSNRQQRR